MRFVLAVLALVTLASAADRVVLLENFTNSGCGPCWSIEGQLNQFVADNIASGRLAVIRVHVNWPSAGDPIYTANPTEQNVRKAQYGVSSVPFLIFDGIQVTAAPSLTNHFNSRLNVPAYIDILVARNGDETSGHISIRIIAEQEPQWAEETEMRVWPILVEDQVQGAGHWAGTYFKQAFRDNLLGPYGGKVEFTGPYPDTIYVDAEYEIAPSWNPDNLFLATFLQCSYQQSDHEVPNADWCRFIDIPQGVGDGMVPQAPSVTLGVNPGTGLIPVAAELPPGVAGTLQLFDITGRMVSSMPAAASGSFSVNEAGVYFVRLTTETGESAVATAVVVR